MKRKNKCKPNKMNDSVEMSTLNFFQTFCKKMKKESVWREKENGADRNREKKTDITTPY